MNTPVQWSYDVADVIAVQELLESVYENSGKAGISGRGVTDARNRLDTLVRDFAKSGMEEDHPDAYLCLLDALAFLNVTLRLPLIDRRYVRMACAKLDVFFSGEVIS